MKKPWFWPLVVLLVGCGLLAAKVVYSFFPYFNLVDIIVFATVGVALGILHKTSSLLTGIVLAIPTMILCGYFVQRLGTENIMSGIGTGWLLSILLVPLSAIAGVYVGTVLGSSRSERRP